MKWWGKILGGALGYALSESIIGVIIGMLLGHQLDRSTQSGKMQGLGGNSRSSQERNSNSHERTQATFFSATFSVMGYISKSSGRVSQEEIQLAEHVMQQMRLTKEQRIEAIELFNHGKQSDFDLDETLEKFYKECNRKTALMQMFIEIQLQAAYADGSKNPREEEILQHICTVLGYPPVLLAQMEAMLFASRRSHQSHRANGSAASSALEDAYNIIGVSSSSTDADVKKAYRRLMSQNHPDKLISKGLPEEMIEIATNKTKEIQKAYDLISTSRN